MKFNPIPDNTQFSDEEILEMCSILNTPYAEKEKKMSPRTFHLADIVVKNFINSDTYVQTIDDTLTEMFTDPSVTPKDMIDFMNYVVGNRVSIRPGLYENFHDFVESILPYILRGRELQQCQRS